MKIVSINVVPWSSVVGQSVTMHDEAGRCVASLNVRTHDGQDPKKGARAAAERIAEAFNALSEKEAVDDLGDVEILET